MEQPTLEQKKEELNETRKILEKNLVKELEIRRTNNALRLLINAIEKDVKASEEKK